MSQSFHQTWQQQKRAPLSNAFSSQNSSTARGSTSTSSFNNNNNKLGSASRVMKSNKNDKFRKVSTLPPPRDGPRLHSNKAKKTERQSISTTTSTFSKGITRSTSSSRAKSFQANETTTQAFDPFGSTDHPTTSESNNDSMAATSFQQFKSVGGGPSKNSSSQGLNKALEEMKESRAIGQQKRMKYQMERQNREKSSTQKNDFPTNEAPLHHDVYNNGESNKMADSVTLTIEEYERLMSTAKKRDDMERIIQERLSFTPPDGAKRNNHSHETDDDDGDKKTKEQYKTEIAKLRKELDEVRFFKDLDDSYDSNGIRHLRSNNNNNQQRADDNAALLKELKMNLTKSKQANEALEMESTYLRQKNQTLLRDNKSLKATNELLQTSTLDNDEKTEMTFHLKSQVISLKACLEEEVLHRERATSAAEEIKQEMKEKLKQMTMDHENKIKNLENQMQDDTDIWESKLSEVNVEYTKTIDNLKETIQMKTEELDELNSNLSNGLELVKDLEEELTPLHEKVEEQTDQIESYEKQIKLQQGKIEKLEKEKVSLAGKAEQNMEQLIQSYDEEIEEKNNEVKELEAQLEKVSTDLIVESGRKIASLQSEHEEKRKKLIEDYDSKLNDGLLSEENARNELHETLTKLAAMEEKMLDLEKKNAEADKDFIVEQMKTEIAQKDAKISELIDECSELKEQIQRLNATSKTTVEQISAIESQYQQELETKDKEATVQYNHLMTTNSTLQQSLTETEKKLSEKSKEYKELDIKFKKSRKEIFEIKLQSEDNETERKKIEADLIETESKYGMVTLTAKKNEEYATKKIKELETKLQNISFNSTSSLNDEAVMDLRSELQSKNEEIIALNAKVQNLTNQLNNRTPTIQEEENDPYPLDESMDSVFVLNKNQKSSLSKDDKYSIDNSVNQSFESCNTDRAVNKKYQRRRKDKTIKSSPKPSPKSSPNRSFSKQMPEAPTKDDSISSADISKSSEKETPQASPNAARKKIEEAALKRYMAYRQRKPAL